MSTLTGAIGSPVAAIVQHLLSVSTITDIVDQKVFGGALPRGSAKFTNAVVVRMAGGLPDMDQSTLHRPRLEFRCYAETDAEAETLYQALYAALNGQIGIQANDVLIKSIWMASMGANLYDEDVNKPFLLSYADSIFQTEKLSA